MLHGIRIYLSDATMDAMQPRLMEERMANQRRAVVVKLESLLMLIQTFGATSASVAYNMTDLRTNMNTLLDLKDRVMNGVKHTKYFSMPSFIRRVDEALIKGANYINTQLRNKLDCSFCGSGNVNKHDSCPARIVGSGLELFQTVYEPRRNVPRGYDGKWGQVRVVKSTQGNHGVHGGVFTGQMLNDAIIASIRTEDLKTILDHGGREIGYSTRIEMRDIVAASL